MRLVRAQRALLEESIACSPNSYPVSDGSVELAVARGLSRARLVVLLRSTATGFSVEVTVAGRQAAAAARNRRTR
jgi:hypothetical protein